MPPTQNGTIVNISTRIVLGDEIEILKILEDSKGSKTISISLVESRNGSFGKDDKGLTRKTKCYSKKVQPHDAHIVFLKAVYNRHYVNLFKVNYLIINTLQFLQFS